MTDGAERLAVPPRDLAATFTALGVLRAGWAVSGVYIFLGIVSLGALWADRRYSSLAFLPLVAAIALLSALLALTQRPSRRWGIAFLIVGTIANFVWVYGLLSVDPVLDVNGIYVLNRLTVAMLLVGAIGSRLIDGVAWCTVGWLLGSGSTIAAQLSLGATIQLGYGPVVALAIYIVIILMFVFIRKSQRRFTAAFSSMEREPARITGQRELEERAISILHDTVLNDLAAVVHAKDKLDERTLARFTRDIDAVANAETLPENSKPNAADWLRTELLSAISDYQWRGLSVEVTGGGEIPELTTSSVADALQGAMRACLENVVRHSGSDSAEVFVDSTTTELSVMIVDHGSGFDVRGVPTDRLGLKNSIVQRIEAVGGQVKIWSAPGAGTSVVIVVPLGAPVEGVVHE